MSFCNVVYLSYGEGLHEAEVRASILTGCFFQKSMKEIRFIVFTDRPASFEGLPVLIRKVEPQEWNSWSGPLGYQHRRKILALETAFQEFEGPIVLVDGDTWWRGPPERLFSRIKVGKSVMHIREGRLDRVHDPVYEQVLTIVDQLSSTGLTILQSVYMWNAGVVGLHPSDARLLPTVLKWTDMLCSVSTDSHVLEQLAFSHVLSTRGRISEAADIVFHYWPRNLRSELHLIVRLVDANRKRLTAKQAGGMFINALPRQSVHRRMAGVFANGLHYFGFFQETVRRSQF